MPNALERLERGRETLAAGKPAAALRLLAGAWTAALAADAEFLRGESFRQQGFFVKAIRAYQGVLRRPVGEDPLRWGEAALGLSSAWRSLGKTAEANRLVSQAQAMAQKRGLADLAEDLRLESLMIARAQERYGLVIPRLKAEARRALAAKDPAKAAYLFWAIGGAERFDGRLAASEKTFRRSLALARKAGDGAGQAYALFGLGGISRILGRLADSERYYRAAGRGLSRTDDVFGKAYAECGLANALRQQGRLEEAFRRYEKAYKLYSSLDDELDLAYVDWGLGKIHLQRGQLGPASVRLRAALAAFERGGETRGVVLARVALSSTLHAQGRTPQAERVFESGVRLARRSGIHAHLESFT